MSDKPQREFVITISQVDPGTWKASGLGQVGKGVTPLKAIKWWMRYVENAAQLDLVNAEIGKEHP